MAHDPEKDFDQQRALLKRVSALVKEGKIRASKDEFREGMQAFLPEHPLRFSLILKSVNTANVTKYLEERKNQASDDVAQLFITDEGVVYWGLPQMSLAQLGKVSSKDKEIIDSLGDMRTLYKIRPLEVKFDETAEPAKLEYFAIEMVRPELYFDENGSLYSPDDPSGPNEASSDGAEAAPIILQNALEKILRQERGEKENFPRGHDGPFKGLGGKDSDGE